jgi:DNA-binding HxlR family transcriptional regulator
VTRKHPYQLLCPIARALDVVGDRWALLILRDLHAGPARFQELHDGLGVATNLLTTRLTELSESGVIEKLDVDGHSAYALTDLGRQTDLLIWELSRFGGMLEPEPDPRQPGNLRTIVLPLRIALNSVEDRPNLAVRLLIEDESFTVLSSPDAVDIEYGETNTVADLVIRTNYVGFLDVGEGRISLEEFAAQHLEIVQGPEHIDSFATLMSAAVAANV